MHVTVDEAHRAWITAERIKRVADRLIGLGPFSIGLDGLLAPVPVAGTLFCFGAGVWLIAEGVKARASPYTLARMVFYIAVRTISSVIPIEGWFVDIFFRAHMMAANALQRDIAERFGEPSAQAVRQARRWPLWSGGSLPTRPSPSWG
ncbi:MAG TPA: DUF4112 domain-containing protein [Caulobacteraceae bacterium]|nr:DUF4112 domain-containing protein [Caulobacteraceae bacterium]